MQKECITCEEVKEITEYHKKKTSSDGFRGECKVCTRARNNRNRSLKPSNLISKIDKTCSSCNTLKTYSEFYVCGTSTDGLRGICKECVKSNEKKKNYEVSVTVKKCSSCRSLKESSEFNKSSRSKDGLRPKCNDCCGTVRKKYYWENREKLLAQNKEFRDANKHLYLVKSKNRRNILSKKINTLYNERMREIYYVCEAVRGEVNYQVDHIIPLTHKKVCGLHVPWNIQLLSKSENCSKSNKFDGTNDNESWR